MSAENTVRAHLSTSAVPRPVLARALRTPGRVSMAASVPSLSGSLANTMGTVSTSTRCRTVSGSAAILRGQPAALWGAKRKFFWQGFVVLRVCAGLNP